jgi:hypothetical protein
MPKRCWTDNGPALHCHPSQLGRLTKEHRKGNRVPHTVGCNYTAIAAFPVRGAKNPLALMAPRLSPLGAGCTTDYRELKAAGIQFGYHNHAFEFVRTTPENYGKDPQRFSTSSSKKAAPTSCWNSTCTGFDHAGASPGKSSQPQQGPRAGHSHQGQRDGGQRTGDGPNRRRQPRLGQPRFRVRRRRCRVVLLSNRTFAAATPSTA